MKISVCLIVKNEEEVLERCLKCVKKFADEIVVVDSNSTDKTVQIAKRFTDKIYNYNWDNNFSNARNFSFQKATCDFVMWLDADDFIDDENISKILKLKNSNKKVDVYMFKYITYCNDKFGFSFYRERLLRKNEKCVWAGFIHEAIAPYGIIEFCDIEILHLKKQQSNSNRNYKIFRYHLKNGQKFSPREQYYYAKELFFLKRYYSCEKEIKKFLKMENKMQANEFDANVTLVRCLKMKNKFLKCLAILNQLSFKFGVNAELLCEYGDVYFLQNNFEMAKLFYSDAIECENNINIFGVFENGVYKFYYPALQLVCANFKLNKFEDAKFWQSKLEKFFPDDNIVKSNKKFFK